ncbi:MAG: 2-amino-4-hydroxy-6-hydroxymethyldihydropteridine diphosphokinase [Pseudomonadales bacterium]|nr:2-amino-4-hydroxy-6-hydroxymethyldihydropteridine diphosphokinase [Pseudomonadales bacterium]
MEKAPSDAVKTYAFIALGANLPSRLGDARQTLDYALKRVAELSCGPVLRSSFWLSTALDCPPGSPDFINAVAGILPAPQETPHSLLKKLQGIEDECGRQRSGLLNEARVLDLDLIVFQEHQCHTSDLQLPHPRAVSRKFVLEPLREIAPDLVIPGQDLGLSALIAGLRGQSLQRMP